MNKEKTSNANNPYEFVTRDEKSLCLSHTDGSKSNASYLFLLKL